MRHFPGGLGLVMLLMGLAAPDAATRTPPSQKAAVAHRGASAYAPEHTLAAYRLAIEQGADYVEQDLAVTSDGVLICLHDDSLERTTNVTDVFPHRWTRDPDGRRRWFAADFTLDEIRQLDAGTWFHPRFAGERVPTWDEAVAAVGTAAGLYPELKSPAYYQTRGVDQTTLFIESVQRLELDARPAGSLIVQSFDEQTLRELARALPGIPRTFLIGRSSADWLTPDRLADIAGFATGIGPNKRLINGRPDIVQAAHALGLTVTPYTFTTRVPWIVRWLSRNVTEEMRYYLYELNVDAVFTDNPDRFPREATAPRGGA